MCGLAGFINKNQLSDNELNSIALEMSSSLHHRGPDSSGIWLEDTSKVAFAHARLSIQDLSEAGHQPMHSFSGRYVISFNGEIYNHLKIRSQLDAIQSLNINWIGHSDTETILNAIDIWGINKTLENIEGMFAFALWDKIDKELILCRDKLGEKPIYYGKVNDSFVFGSELKAFKKFPGFIGKISRDALKEYIQFNYVPSPLSIYENIFKLEPGYYLTIEYSSLNIEKFQYWSLGENISSFKALEIEDEETSIELLEDAIESSIKSQMLSDVPLGAFLSGGIDSSLVVAKMQKFSNKKIKTFTIGFEDKDYDESLFAKAVSDHFKTNHFTMNVTEKDALQVIKSLPDIFDEPFADSSQIPTYLVSKAAQEEVSVILSGDAGDEIFGGYNRYIWVPRLWKFIKYVPLFIRRFCLRNIISIKISTWNKILSNFSINRPGEKLHKFAEAMVDAKSSQHLYFNILRQWKNPENLIKQIPKNTKKNHFFDDTKLKTPINLSDSEQMMFFDSLSYLPDDILVKVDRAAMSLSLESRVPFINMRVIELAWRMNIDTKIKNGKSKNPLRLILKKYLPDEMINRPKTGFGLPIGDWLKGPLFDWANNLLDPKKIDNDGFFFSEPIQTVWQEHLQGITDHSAKLWGILMFQAWLEKECIQDRK